MSAVRGWMVGLHGWRSMSEHSDRRSLQLQGSRDGPCQETTQTFARTRLLLKPLGFQVEIR